LTDRIRLNEMAFFGYHGALPEERSLGQRFIVDIEVEADLKKAGESDALEDTINYSELYTVAEDIVMGPPFNLIEAVAERIATRILSEQAAVEAVLVRIRKPGVPIPGSVLASSEICIERKR
jgi:7,8-dihydroneopterin aldolase/epimerase/oxygenase